MKYIILFLTFISLQFSIAQTKSLVEIPSIFSDNMVLQQKAIVPVWGKAKPGEKVIVKGSWGASAYTIVQVDSLWKVKIKTPKAGGPFLLKIIFGDTTITYKDVMLGEVWFCSGQSNMEMPLEGWPPIGTMISNIDNSAQEIKDANYPEIRLFTVARALSNKPEFNCNGKWTECNPQTAAKFSAVAYFFGRKLYKELNVPIGLINSSWGGTYIQSWISGKFLSQLDEYKSVIKNIAGISDEIKKQKIWIFNHPAIDITSKYQEYKWENLQFGDSLCLIQNFNDTAWKTMNLPANWGSTALGNFCGAVWFRKKIEIPTNWLQKNLVLELGTIGGMDISYVNGAKVGSLEKTGSWQTRIYDVPKEIVNSTSLTIAVRVLYNGKSGLGGIGIWGEKAKMNIHLVESDDKISLAGSWKYLPAAELVENKIYIYQIQGEEFYSRPSISMKIDPNTPTMLYNGMIAPIIPYYIKGTIWYQGESNADLPNDYNNYGVQFPLMIKNWRMDWGEGDFSFYYAQIAPYSYWGLEQWKSQIIREAQLNTLSVPNTGMAVLLDIGSDTTIHPANKQDAGQRLALWALAKNYHKKVIYSGPLYKSMKVDKNRIVISFKFAGKSLVVKPQKGNSNFKIAGNDKRFVNAFTKVDGTKLIIFSSEIEKPVAVRYGWSNFIEGNLFNKEGLPASSFRTDDWGK